MRVFIGSLLVTLGCSLVMTSPLFGVEGNIGYNFDLSKGNGFFGDLRKTINIAAELPKKIANDASEYAQLHGNLNLQKHADVAHDHADNHAKIDLKPVVDVHSGGNGGLNSNSHVENPAHKATNVLPNVKSQLSSPAKVDAEKNFGYSFDLSKGNGFFGDLRKTINIAADLPKKTAHDASEYAQLHGNLNLQKHADVAHDHAENHAKIDLKPVVDVHSGGNGGLNGNSHVENPAHKATNVLPNVKSQLSSPAKVDAEKNFGYSFDLSKGNGFFGDLRKTINIAAEPPKKTAHDASEYAQLHGNLNLQKHEDVAHDHVEDRAKIDLKPVVDVHSGGNGGLNGNSHVENPAHKATNVLPNVKSQLSSPAKVDAEKNFGYSFDLSKGNGFFGDLRRTSNNAAELPKKTAHDAYEYSQLHGNSNLQKHADGSASSDVKNVVNNNFDNAADVLNRGDYFKNPVLDILPNTKNQ